MSRTATRDGMERKKLRLASLAVSVLLVAGFSVVALPAQAGRTSTAFPGTGFGGYRWMNGPVTQISAQWRVPRILPTSSQGSASTWIGAQNQDGPPFIQLGTVENKFDLFVPTYSAFWSDPDVGFHPQNFGAVGAGDLVSAELIRMSSGWRLTFRDITRSTTKSRVVKYGLTGSYDQGEWLQEDPSPSDLSKIDLPYPKTSLVEFEDLRVDGDVPKLDLADGQVMLANGGAFLVPSRVTDGTFFFGAPSGPQKSYLEAARNVDIAISAFAVDSLRWKTLSTSERESIAPTIGQAFGKFSTAISTLSLSKTSETDAVGLEQQNRRVQSDFDACRSAGCPTGSTAFLKISEDLESIGAAADKLRASLGLSPS
jgi:hypothetical protein